MGSLSDRRSVLGPVLLSAVLLGVLASPLSSQQSGESSPARRPDPSLSALVGRWMITDLPPGATYYTTCELLPGGYQVVCRSESRNNEGRFVQGMNIIAFSPEGGDYHYVGTSSTGRLELLRGTFADGRLLLTGTTGTGATAVQTRVTIAPGRNQIEITQEYREGNNPWTESTRVRFVPAPQPQARELENAAPAAARDARIPPPIGRDRAYRALSHGRPSSGMDGYTHRVRKDDHPAHLAALTGTVRRMRDDVELLQRRINEGKEWERSAADEPCG